MIGKRELKQLKRQMPERYRDTLKKRTGFCYSYIDMVFRGERNNQKIIDAAFDLLKENITKEERQKELLTQK